MLTFIMLEDIKFCYFCCFIIINSYFVFVSFSAERGASSGSMLFDGAQGGLFDMVDFHNFLQDVLETGGLDIGM